MSLVIPDPTADMIADSPLVSVIICTRNRRELVTRAIESVLAQESVTLELIVVDDCSDDNTGEILKQRYENRITLLELKENRRVAYATNRGFDISRGEYIALLGDDDFWVDSKKLVRQMLAFQCNGADLGIVGTWWRERHASGELVAREPNEPNDWKERLLEGGGIICGSTPLIRRSAWIAAGGLDERLARGTDSDLFRRIILSGFKGKILNRHTTIVDVGHGLSRMTATRGTREAFRIASVHAYLLWKYKLSYLRRPRAMFTRLKSLIFGFAVTISRTVSDLSRRAPS
jgi:glycosyltransferase involved in cell wall biosynthesis